LLGLSIPSHFTVACRALQSGIARAGSMRLAEASSSCAGTQCRLAKRAIIAIIVFLRRCRSMASLVVRNLDSRVVDALKQRAAKHGRSAEAEHRALLEELLLRPKRKNFAQVLADIPNVGEDSDFVRVDDPGERGNVFD
jgi:plasmid stability protein